MLFLDFARNERINVKSSYSRASCAKVGTGFLLKTIRQQNLRARDLRRILRSALWKSKRHPLDVLPLFRDFPDDCHYHLGLQESMTGSPRTRQVPTRAGTTGPARTEVGRSRFQAPCPRLKRRRDMGTQSDHFRHGLTAAGYQATCGSRTPVRLSRTTFCSASRMLRSRPAAIAPEPRFLSTGMMCVPSSSMDFITASCGR